MKNYFILIIVLMYVPFVSKGQHDTSTVEINFHTKGNHQIGLYEVVHIGDIDLTGYDSEGYLYHKGTLTKQKFLLNVPNTYKFRSDSIYELVMKSEHDAGMNFIINTEMDNQTWLLTPAGIKFNMSRKQIYHGIIGVIISSATYGLIAMLNSHEKAAYEMELAHYNRVNGMGAGSFFQYTSPPEKPDNLGLRYILPTIAMVVSVSITINGKNLYRKNKPMAVRIK